MRLSFLGGRRLGLWLGRAGSFRKRRLPWFQAPFPNLSWEMKALLCAFHNQTVVPAAPLQGWEPLPYSQAHKDTAPGQGGTAIASWGPSWRGALGGRLPAVGRAALGFANAHRLAGPRLPQTPCPQRASCYIHCVTDALKKSKGPFYPKATTGNSKYSRPAFVTGTDRTAFLSLGSCVSAP